MRYYSERYNLQEVYAKENLSRSLLSRFYLKVDEVRLRKIELR